MDDDEFHTEGPGPAAWLGISICAWTIVLAGVLLYFGTRWN